MEEIIIKVNGDEETFIVPSSPKSVVEEDTLDLSKIIGEVYEKTTNE